MTDLDLEPKYAIGAFTCNACGRTQNVSLVSSENSRVQWCCCGRVSVVKNGETTEVYNFCPPKPEPKRTWLPGYAMTVEDVDGKPLAVFYAPTMTDGEREICNDISMGAFGDPEVIKRIVCEWHEELIPDDSPAAELWK